MEEKPTYVQLRAQNFVNSTTHAQARYTSAQGVRTKSRVVHMRSTYFGCCVAWVNSNPCTCLEDALEDECTKQ